jgi:hypothetical protein
MALTPKQVEYIEKNISEQVKKEAALSFAAKLPPHLVSEFWKVYRAAK